MSSKTRLLFLLHRRIAVERKTKTTDAKRKQWNAVPDEICRDYSLRRLPHQSVSLIDFAHDRLKRGCIRRSNQKLNQLLPSQLARATVYDQQKWRAHLASQRLTMSLSNSILRRVLRKKIWGLRIGARHRIACSSGSRTNLQGPTGGTNRGGFRDGCSWRKRWSCGRGSK